MLFDPGNGWVQCDTETLIYANPNPLVKQINDQQVTNPGPTCLLLSNAPMWSACFQSKHFSRICSSSKKRRKKRVSSCLLRRGIRKVRRRRWWRTARRRILSSNWHSNICACSGCPLRFQALGKCGPAKVQVWMFGIGGFYGGRKFRPSNGGLGVAVCRLETSLATVNNIYFTC